MTLFRRDSQPLDPDDSDSSSIREWREGLSLIAASERPGLRFKPYVTYTREHTNDNPEWRETGRAGFWGPVSDYLDLTASAGFTKEPGGSTDHLYDLSLLHQPRWNTTQAVTFSRTITLPEDKLVTESNYRLQHQISDYWGAAAFVGREVSERKVNGITEQDTEWGAGGSLIFSPGPKLRMALRGIYDDRKTGGSSSPGADNGGEWNWNLAATYQFTPELDFYYSYTREQKDWEHLFETKLRRGKLELAYRFIWSEDHEPDKEERENLLILTYRVPL
jgi:outer membrane receptor protein involved in Fe transport